MSTTEKNRIRVLHLEDDPIDAELVSATLESEGLMCDIVCVDNKEDFVAKLCSGHFDVILSDYSLPQFDGLTALCIVRERFPEIPFILLSGMLGEEVATDSIKAGATDYVLKQRITRLVPSVTRALREAEDRLQRRKAEDALNESEEKYRNLVDNLDIGVTLISPDMKIVTCNHQVRKWFPVIDSNYRLGLTTEYNVFCLENYQQQSSVFPVPMAVEDGQKHECVRVLKFDDTEKSFRFIATPIKDLKGTILGIIEIMEDVTEKINNEKERKVLEERLQQAQKMEAIGTLAGGIAHDLNNILAPIMVYTEMILLDTPPGSQQEVKLREVLNATERARDLIRQILQFSRQKPKEIKPVMVSDIISEVLKLIRPSTPSTIEIRYESDSATDLIFADPTQIHQVIMNLCTNASYSMRENGGVLEIILTTVNLDLETATDINNLKAGQYKKISVKDNGTGMDKDVVQRIFEPYFTTKKVGEGTGMGLAVIHGIVKSLNGTITVDSEPGRGSTFIVYLPIAENLALTQLIQGNDLKRGTERILLIDDEKTIVKAMQTALTLLGYNVTATTDSRDGLRLFLENPCFFDLVITDMTMPVMTGRELASEILSVRPDIPILMCTGYNEMINNEVAREIGIKELIAKPISLHEIAGKIHDVLHNRNAWNTTV
jgi:signal transduction histidine kinase/DNA-binding response OmpR family regulator